eukprot:4780240-Pyramimonas_sp.AAC.1
MAKIGAAWMRVKTQQLTADGLTKPSARQSVADVLLRGAHAPRCDPDFAAGKKISKRAMEQREK